MAHKPITYETFASFTTLSSLKSSKNAAAFLAHTANLKTNTYDAGIWFYRWGQVFPARQCENMSQFWWKDEQTLVVCGQETAYSLESPVETCLSTVQAQSEETPVHWQNLPFDVREMLFLPTGDFLFVAADHHRWRQVLSGADGDLQLAQKQYEQQERQQVQVSESFPFWEEGGGFTGGETLGLYLWKDGCARRLTPETLSVEQAVLCVSGKSVYFTAKENRVPAPFANRLYQLDLENGEQKEISGGDSFVHESFVSMTPESLMVLGGPLEPGGINQNWNFYRVDLKNNSWNCVYDKKEYGFGDSVVSDIKMGSDGGLVAERDGVYWITTLEDSSHVMYIHPGTGMIRQVTGQNGTVQQLALCGGDILLLGTGRGMGQELFRLDSQGEKRRLTSFNDSPMKEYQWRRPRAVMCTGDGGRVLQGWAIHPDPWYDQEKCPTVLYIHGGPKLAYGHGMHHEMQLLAEMGFGVLYCNPSGSDGRGGAFADIRGEGPQRDAQDLMHFLEVAIEENPWVDPGRIGICGGSYGGYMANWLIGSSNRFRAAVSQRGIADWESMMLTSDIGPYYVPDQTGTGENPDRQVLWEKSPLRLAGEVDTPTLFIHGKEDRRCPWGQSAQMYGALRMHGVPARLCVFENENHGLSRNGRPLARIRRLQEIAEWFGKYL